MNLENKNSECRQGGRVKKNPKVLGTSCVYGLLSHRFCFLLQRHHGEAIAPNVEQAGGEQAVGGQGGGREGEEEEDQQVNEAVVVVECLIDIVIERSITTISN